MVRQGRTVSEVIAAVQVTRALLVLVLAFLTLSLVMSIGTRTTGPAEKVVLLACVGACLYATVYLTRCSQRLVQRLARH